MRYTFNSSFVGYLQILKNQVKMKIKVLLIPVIRRENRVVLENALQINPRMEQVS